MKLLPEVISVLASLQYQPDRIVIATGMLDRKVYKQVDDVLVTAGAEWNRAKKAHVVPASSGATVDDVREVIESAIRTGSTKTLKEMRSELGAFMTPKQLATDLVSVLPFQKGTTLLEPSCGDGAIVVAALWRGASVLCIDIDPARTSATMRNAMDAIKAGAPGDFTVYVGDFVELSRKELVPKACDAVAMNPPFCRSGQGNHMDHVLTALDHLKDDGRLRAILPSSVVHREDASHRRFRDAIHGTTRNATFTDLPPGSFASSGTMVNTVLLECVK